MYVHRPLASFFFFFWLCTVILFCPQATRLSNPENTVAHVTRVTAAQRDNWDGLEKKHSLSCESIALTLSS